MKTLNFKYYRRFLAIALFLVTLSVGCNNKESDPQPGVDTKLTPPKSLTAKVMGATVNFTWNGQKEAIAFRLQVSATQDFSNLIEDVQVTSSSYTMEGFAKNTVYYSRVQAIAEKEQFNSDFTDRVAFKTGNENILKATPLAISDRAMTLQWLAGVEVTHMVITSTVDGASPQTLTISEAEKTNGEKEITGLDYETTYDVLLYNNANVRGEGVYTTLPREMDPITITITAKPDSALLSWAAGADVTYFTLASETDAASTITLSATNIALGKDTLAALKTSTDYVLTAYWKNPTTGTSSDCGSTSFTTTALPTVTVSVPNISVTAATVTWTPSDVYVTRLLFSPALSSGSVVAITPADAGTKSCTGMAPNTNYSVTLQYVSGSNIYNRSSKTFTTLEAVPAATVSVVGTPAQTSATLSWTPANANYTIMNIAPSSGSPLTYSVNGATDAAGKAFAGLTAGTSYTASLQYIFEGVLQTAGTVAFTTAASTVTPSGNKFWNISDYPASTVSFTSTTTILTDLTVLAATGQNVDIDGNSKSIDGNSFTKRLKLGGAPDNLTLPTYRALQFNVSGACTITVYGMSSSGGTSRTINITNGTSILDTYTNDGTAIGKKEIVYTGGAGTIYILSTSGGFNIYGVKVDYPSTPSPTNKEWNISDYPASTVSFTSTTTILTDLTVLAATGQNVDIDGNSKSIDGYSFTKRLKLGGASDNLILPTYRALQFNVASACTITVYGMSSSSGVSRTLNITNGTSILDTYTNDGTAIGKKEIVYTGGAGTIYILSTSGGFNIYGVKVTY